MAFILICLVGLIITLVNKCFDSKYYHYDIVNYCITSYDYDLRELAFIYQKLCVREKPVVILATASLYGPHILTHVLWRRCLSF